MMISIVNQKNVLGYNNFDIIKISFILLDFIKTRKKLLVWFILKFLNASYFTFTGLVTYNMQTKIQVKFFIRILVPQSLVEYI